MDIPIFPNGADFNSQKLLNLLKGVADTDGVNVKQLNDAIALALSGRLSFKGDYNATTNTPNLTTPAPGAVLTGDMYVVTVGGTFFGEVVEPGDVMISKTDDPSSLTDWAIVQDNLVPGFDIGALTEVKPVQDGDFHVVDRGGTNYKVLQSEVNNRNRAEAIEQNNALSTTFAGNNTPTPLLWDGAGGAIFLHNFTYSKAGNTGVFTSTDANAQAGTERRYLMIARIAFVPSSGSSSFNFYMGVNGAWNAPSRTPQDSKGGNDIHEVTIVKNTAIKENDTREIFVERTAGSGSLRVESINWIIVPIGQQNA